MDPRPSLEDWSLAPQSVVTPLVAAEAREWGARLGWDVRQTWGVIEPARVSGRLAGLVARDFTGRIVGWSCFLVHRDVLQVAMLVAETALVTEALVDAVAGAHAIAGTVAATVSVRIAAPGITEALRRRGFDTVRYRYLSAGSVRTDSCLPGLRAWQDTDVDALQRLCMRAYADPTQVRAFAPLGTHDEWRDYVTDLVTGGACGRLMTDATFVLPSGTGELEAAVVVTNLGPGTAHIAQLVVDPAAAGHGLGRGMACAALDATARKGFERVTLLVSEANARAGRLYDRLGFEERADFVVGIDR